MKKIILSMAMLAMVGATATAQKNNDGLTPSRPLTSGELFQGMSSPEVSGRLGVRPSLFSCAVAVAPTMASIAIDKIIFFIVLFDLMLFFTCHFRLFYLD